MKLQMLVSFFSKKELESLFPKIGRIKKIEILNITKTGRLKNVKLFGNYGSYEMSGVDLRKRLNLKSNLIRFKIVEDKKNISGNDNSENFIKKSLIVLGQGSGHGVGMSQWGARYMASKGIKAEKILKHFYKGVKIKPFNKNFL